MLNDIEQHLMPLIPMFNMKNKRRNNMLFKVEEVAKMLRVSDQTIRRLIQDNELTAIKVGRQARIDSAHLSQFLTKTNGGRNNAIINN